jgi:short-subunit dehydrogenase
VTRPVGSGRGALITGASAGIGLALARCMAADGWNLALTARNEAALNTLARELHDRHGIDTLIVPHDLADPAGPVRLEETLVEAGFTVDFLVNNAGFGTWGPFTEQTLSSQLDMLRVNVLALTELTHRFVAAMRIRNWGRVLNVASTAAFQPGPDMAVYYASKAYVLHFSEALREELDGSGVCVTTLCPGPTATEFQDRASMNASWVGATAFMMEADPVAEAGSRGALAGRAVVVPGIANRVGSWLPRFLPRSVTRKAAGFVNSPR